MARRLGIWLRTILSIVFIVILLMAGMAGFKKLAALRQEPEAREGQRPEISVRTVTTVRTDHRERVIGFGLARALRESEVGAEVTARIEWISPRLEAGVTVKKHEVLVRLDGQDFRREINRLLARSERIDVDVAAQDHLRTNLDEQLVIATRELEASRRELDRLRRLENDRVTSSSEADGQRMRTAALERSLLELRLRRNGADVDTARSGAESKQIEVELAMARANLARCEIATPYAGVVTARTARLGERVAAGASLFHLVDPAAVEIPVALPASRYGQIGVGAEAEVVSEDGGATWTAQVERISPRIDDDSRTFMAYLVVRADANDAGVEDKPSPTLAPGRFVRAAVPGRLHEGVIVLPRVAFVGEDVFVVEPTPDEGQGTARVRTVSPEIEQWLPSRGLVGAGLDEGVRVVVSNLERIANGSRVIVVNEDDVVGDGAGR